MANTKKKTISGAMYSKPNLEHNLREHIPPNSVEKRRYLNLVYTRMRISRWSRFMISCLLIHIRNGGRRRLRRGEERDFPKLITKR